MATVTLQYFGPMEGMRARSIAGPVSGNLYLINSIGQFDCASVDLGYFQAQGWSPAVPTSGSIGAAILVDFGAFPGSSYASATIPDSVPPGDTNALVQAYVVPIATADHSADEHLVDGPILSVAEDGAGNLIISAIPNGQVFQTDGMMPWGKWSVAWNFLQ